MTAIALQEPIQAQTLPNLGSDPREIVDVVMDSIAKPADPVEEQRFTHVASLLGRLDGGAANLLLEQSVARPGGSYLRIPVYGLIVLGLRALQQGGFEVAQGADLLRAIRQQVRHELNHLPIPINTVWLIPATAGDITAAHVASLVLARRGQTDRPWIWTRRPDHNRCVRVTCDGRAPASAHHQRFETAINLAQLLARQIGRLQDRI